MVEERDFVDPHSSHGLCDSALKGIHNKQKRPAFFIKSARGSFSCSLLVKGYRAVGSGRDDTCPIRTRYSGPFPVLLTSISACRALLLWQGRDGPVCRLHDLPVGLNGMDGSDGMWWPSSSLSFPVIAPSYPLQSFITPKSFRTRTID